MPWEDHRDIERLMFDYARAVDRADFDEVGRILGGATVTTNVSPDEAVGAKAIAAQWRSTNRVHPDGTLRTRHLLTNVTIEFDESNQSARADAYFTVFQATDALALQPIVSGSYVDRFQRDDGAWRFAAKHIEIALVGDVSDHLVIDLKDPEGRG